ncbi:MAG: GYF domain-containing protein [Kineosporiaceae bacterium]
MVWKSGLAAWTPAQDVPELAPVLGAAPPPLPPA